MISLEQIRTLESKVNKAVNLLAALQEENQGLKAKLAEAKARIEELEFTVEEYREDQNEIEQGIISALEHLDNLESAVGGLKAQPAPAAEDLASFAQEDLQETLSAEPAPAPAAELAVEAEEPAVEEAASEPAVEVTGGQWEAPAARFDAPSPVSDEPYGEDPVESEESNESRPAANREQQLDIF